jgi:CDP-diacylglycerol--serine O-phosphatidyltransferase
MKALSNVPFFPSLITLGNAFCGFLAIIKITDAAFLVGSHPLTEALRPEVFARIETAGLLIFLAMVFDALDGKVARLTDQTTDFGAQLDSLADVITFGVAPAVLAKFMVDLHQPPHGSLLPSHPKFYYLCAALFALFAVMRLARFNVETPDHSEEAHSEFSGLPTPAAAAAIVSLLLFTCAQKETGEITNLLFSPEIYNNLIRFLPLVLFLTGLLMISTLPYPHFMNTVFRGKKSFPFLALAVFVLILGALEWRIVLLILCSLYLLTGPLIGLTRLFFGGRGSGSDGNDEEDGQPPQEGGGPPQILRRVESGPVN